MKKNNDGYVLPFVLVVMIVLTIISTSLMTAALRNLQSQQKFTERMVDKYEAEGEIEKIVAQLSREENFENLEEPAVTPVEKETIAPETNAGKSLKAKIEELCGAVTFIEWTELAEDETISCSFTVESIVETAVINSTIELSGKVTENTSDEVVIGGSKTTYTITDLKLTYKSYEISTKEVADE